MTNVFKILLGAYIVFMLVIFMRCEKVTEITELVKNTEKIQVIFYNDSTQNTFVDITDKKEIKKFNDFITNDDTPVYKCGYEGRIVFFMADDVAAGTKNSVAMEFNLSDDCRHIAYPYAGGLQTKLLSEDGISYLKNLQHQ